MKMLDSIDYFKGFRMITREDRALNPLGLAKLNHTINMIESESGMHVPSNVVKKFWQLTDKEWEPHPNNPEKGKCWRWTGSKFTNGYGRIYFDGKSRRAHRVAWQIIHGFEDSGLMVCHSCDRPLCVNPAHLFLGTAQENMTDMVKKGRAATGKRQGFYTHPESRLFGPKNGRAVLTEEMVLSIRKRHAIGGITKAALAREYGIGETQTTRIIKRVHWAQI